MRSRTLAYALAIAVSCVTVRSAPAAPGPPTDSLGVGSLAVGSLAGGSLAAEILRDALTVEAPLQGGYVLTRELEVRVYGPDPADAYRTMTAWYGTSAEVVELTGSVQSAYDKRPARAKRKHFSDHSTAGGSTIASSTRYRRLTLPMPSGYPAVIRLRSVQRLDEAIYLPVEGYAVPEGVVLRHGCTTVIDPAGRVRTRLADAREVIATERSGDTTRFSVSELTYRKDASPFTPEGPAIYLAPREGQLEGYAGDFSTWEGLGAWNVRLLEERSVLPEAAVAEVRALTAAASTDAERIALVYEYVQRRSRYVSIQLGIGGWQPMDPAEVHATGYGDCKALTNYTRLLLEAVGVPARYCVIGVQDREIVFPDFPSVNQANHAMLAVPRGPDTVWLECTSQSTPPGYVGERASGRYALLLDGERGHLVRASAGAPEENTYLRRTTIALAADGTADLTYRARYRGNALSFPLALARSEADARDRIWRGAFAVTLADLQHGHRIPPRTILPEGEAELTARTGPYAKRLGDRLMAAAYTFLRADDDLTALKDATAPYDFEAARVGRDTVDFRLPDGMRLSDLPREQSALGPMGTYRLSAKPTENGVRFVRELRLEPRQLEGEVLAEAKTFAAEVLKMDRTVFGVVPDRS